MDKERTIVFGAGGTGKRVYNMIKDNTQVLYFTDNDSQKWGVNGKVWKLSHQMCLKM